MFSRCFLPPFSTQNLDLKTKMVMSDPPLQTYSPLNSDFLPSRFRRDVPRASREVRAVQEAELGRVVQRGSRQEEERRRRQEREDEARRQDGELEREEKLHQKRMEEQEREQVDRRRQKNEFEREEEQTQSELRDERPRTQTSREEATLRE